MSKSCHMRTCIACGKQADKKDLFRVVKSSEGTVFYDESGRASGRGSYVCSEGCFVKARKTKRFERALRTSISNDVFETIADEMHKCWDQ